MVDLGKDCGSGEEVGMEEALGFLADCRTGVVRASDLLKEGVPQCSNALKVLIECRSVFDGGLSGVSLEEVRGLRESSGGFALVAEMLDCLMPMLEEPWDVGVWEQSVTCIEHLGSYQKCLGVLLHFLCNVVRMAPIELIIGTAVEKNSSEATASFVIEDLSGVRESAVSRLLLLVALYSSVIDKLYSDPWASPVLQKQSDELMEVVCCRVTGRSDVLVGGMNSSILGEIVGDHADEIIAFLRSILVKKRPRADDPLKIPDPYERTKMMMRAKGFVWFVESLVKTQLTKSLLDSIFPIAFSTIDNVVPKVRMMGLKVMDVVNDHADCTWFLAWRDVILNVLSDAIAVAHSGMDAEIWHLTFPLASRVVVKVEGNDPRCAGYDTILTSMFGGVSIGLLEKSKRLALMQGFQLLIEAMGLILVKYFTLFMPPLCSYACSEDLDTMAMALQCLMLVSKHTWPRMPAHVNIMWKVVMEAHGIICKQDGLTSPAHEALNGLCKVLVACSKQGAIEFLESPVHNREDKHELFKMLNEFVTEDDPGCS